MSECSTCDGTGQVCVRCEHPDGDCICDTGPELETCEDCGGTGGDDDDTDDEIVEETPDPVEDDD